VFSANPAFKGHRRRLTSREGWPNSRPVRIPASCRELLLRVNFRPQGPDGALGPQRTCQAKLIRHRHFVADLLTDTMFLATGAIR